MKTVHMAFAAALMMGSVAFMPAAAQTVLPITGFERIELRGGGNVIVRHGPRHQVRLIRGNLEMSRIEVEQKPDGSRALVVQTCRRSCRNYQLRIEIESPDVSAATVSGGGDISFRDDFPVQGNVALAVSGGGTIAARPMRATNVAAAVSGGGTIDTHPQATLAAVISGGGRIRYAGDPQVSRVIRGGGDVSPIR